MLPQIWVDVVVTCQMNAQYETQMASVRSELMFKAVSVVRCEIPIVVFLATPVPGRTSIEIVMWFDSGSLFLSCELAASIVFRDNVDGVGE